MKGKSTAEQDRVLVSLLRQGNGDAFERLVSLYSQDLLKQACRLIKDVELAKDLVQDVFLDIWEKHDQLEIETALWPYLQSMLKHRFLRQVSRLDLHQRAMEHVARQMDQLEHTVLDLMAVGDLQQSLSEIVDQLPNNMRAIFALRQEDYSLREIAQALGLAEQTVKSYHAELNRRIKLELLARHPDISHSLLLLLVLRFM
ncbi:RNA polymerase sigma factor [Olivibacter sitiensis]|uniref:RNA polymerase sigma factor n=1 Tax=Olivibacter sitiensis TaxID=376470 RepID=UPI000684E909|nr:sigma-70 family RNA polymerase sigma factor [Olivibacter sitiensis]